MSFGDGKAGGEGKREGTHGGKGREGRGRRGEEEGNSRIKTRPNQVERGGGRKKGGKEGKKEETQGDKVAVKRQRIKEKQIVN